MVLTGFAYHSVKQTLLANGNRYEVEFNTFFLSGKALYPFERIFLNGSISLSQFSTLASVVRESLTLKREH